MASTMLQSLYLLALAAGVCANPVPLPTPPPLKSGTGTDAGLGPLGTPTCTTVLTSVISGFHGENFTPEIAKTVYTDTVTEYARVDCGGCALSVTTELAKLWGGIGPQEIITATTTATQASTTTLTVCRHPMLGSHGQIPGNVENQEPSSGRECTFTKVVAATPHLLGEGDKTVHTTTATTTSHIDCGGCNYVAVTTTDFLHPGPVVPYTSTTTASTPAAATAYVCIKSPSVALPPSTNTTPTPSLASPPTASPPTASPPTASPPIASPPIPSPPIASPPPDFTVLKTITQTIYAATVTTFKTATCGLPSGPGGPETTHGAIPKRGGPESITSPIKTLPPVPKTRTVYSTFLVSDPATWTRTAYRCVGGKGPTSTATPVGGKGPLGVGVLGRGTTPPTHRPVPVSPSGTTTTYNFPG